MMPYAANDRENYRAPLDLALQQRPISRWLVIGSCLASGFPDFVRGLDCGADGDYILFNNAAELPDQPPHPVETYDCQMIQIAMRSIVPDFAHARLDFDDVEGFTQLFETCVGRMEFLLASAMAYTRRHSLPTFVTTLIVPQQGSLGRILGRRDLRDFRYFARQLNERLADIVEAKTNSFLVDINDIIATYGAKYFQDDVLWPYNHAAALTDNDHARDQDRMHVPAPVSDHYTLRTSEIMQAIWEEIKAQYVTLKGDGRIKLVIVDLDDTLWRGVVAEQESPDPVSLEGWPLGLAEALLYLKQRGIVIAIVSKNDEMRIRSLWNTMWQGRLRLEDFVSLKINWRGKAENVAEVIREVNVLPDSVLFIDDNPAERHAVETALPGIRTLGADLYYIRRILLWSPEMQPAVMTGESARRNDMVKAQIERETMRHTLNRAGFLASLDIRYEEVHLTGADHPGFTRVLELLNKTNQYNTTGRRWQRDELAAAFSDGLEIFAFEVSDTFTHYGLVGMALVRGNLVEQFVMSCRVIGLDVELTCLDRIKARHHRLEGLYIDTGKNHPCKDVFARSGFAEVKGEWVWQAQETLLA